MQLHTLVVVCSTLVSAALAGNLGLVVDGPGQPIHNQRLHLNKNAVYVGKYAEGAPPVTGNLMGHRFVVDDDATMGLTRDAVGRLVVSGKPANLFAADKKGVLMFDDISEFHAVPDPDGGAGYYVYTATGVRPKHKQMSMPIKLRVVDEDDAVQHDVPLGAQRAPAGAPAGARGGALGAPQAAGRVQATRGSAAGFGSGAGSGSNANANVDDDLLAASAAPAGGPNMMLADESAAPEPNMLLVGDVTSTVLQTAVVVNSATVTSTDLLGAGAASSSETSAPAADLLNSSSSSEASLGGVQSGLLSTAMPTALVSVSALPSSSLALGGSLALPSVAATSVPLFPAASSAPAFPGVASGATTSASDLFGQAFPSSTLGTMVYTPVFSTAVPEVVSSDSAESAAGFPLPQVNGAPYSTPALAVAAFAAFGAIFVVF